MIPNDYYKLIIIGSGPTGLSGAVNAASEGLSVCVLEQSSEVGGQAKYSSKVENYPGFINGLTGELLTQRFAKQAKRFGATVCTENSVKSVHVDRHWKAIVLESGKEIVCKALLVASGLQQRHMQNISELSGIEYGALPSASLKVIGQNVAVIGCANSATQCALNLASTANKVFLICREAELRKEASEYLVTRILKTANIQILYNAVMSSATGNGKLEQITVKNGDSTNVLQVSYVFVFIGNEPKCDYLGSLVTKDDKGFVMASKHQSKTRGIFVAGDIRSGSIKRIASGVGEGARAISFIHEYLKSI